jgi:formamidopyrimidine-DNA glycosylase
LSYYKDDDALPEYAKLVIDFDNGWHLAYVSQRMLGEVGLVSNYRCFLKEHDLGPDALDDELDADWFVEQVSGRHGMAKTLLMDQSFLAGIGNVYSDEILFQAGLHPETNTSDLSEKELRYLFRTMRRVLRVAVRKNGEVDRLPRGYLLPHRDTDEKCPKCGGDIRKITVSGRSAYICPDCQDG